MTLKNTLIPIGILAVIVGGYFIFSGIEGAPAQNLDATPQNVTLTGTYGCLPHMDTSGPQTMECAFGIQADNGDWYAVNFGASADAMNQFQSGAHVTAEGFVVIKEALSTDQWKNYNIKGIFTVTKILESGPAVQGKLNINAVCEGALAYMTFPDGATADAFVADCKEGKHPEVIEQYKLQMGLGDGAAI